MVRATSGRIRHLHLHGARRGGSGRGGTRADSGPRAAVGQAGSAVAALASLTSKRTLPPEIATEIRNAADVATAVHREHLVERAEVAWGSYERGRFTDALRAIKPLTEETPMVPAVRELAGLAAYRAGRWREAARHLRALDGLADATEHMPVLMDCERALGRPKKVAELWTELRHRSPDPDVLAEGRIVAAACLGDSGDLDGAISMLASAGASKALRNPSDRHIRQWYLLADLYERAGDVPRAREYFDRVLRADPEAYDAAERRRGLGSERRGRARPAPKRVKQGATRSGKERKPGTSAAKD